MGANCTGTGSGEADEEPALRSKSSKRLFIFLPLESLGLGLRVPECKKTHDSSAELSYFVSVVAQRDLRF